MKHTGAHAHRGFTMLELLVVVLLVVMLFGFVGESWHFISQSLLDLNRRSLNVQEAQIAIDTLASDFGRLEAIQVIPGQEKLDLQVCDSLNGTATRNIEYVKEGSQLVRKDLDQHTERPVAGNLVAFVLLPIDGRTVRVEMAFEKGSLTQHYILFGSQP